MEDNKELDIYDELKVRQTPEITTQLKSDEKVYFSGMVTKFNRMEWKQERLFVITNLAIYNIKKHKIQRRIAIKDIDGITKSTDKKWFEFVVHVEVEYDYRFLTNERKRNEIVLILKHCYHNAFGKNLPVYGVAYGHLKDFTTSKKDAAKKISKKPPKGNLLKEEDLFRDKWYKAGKKEKSQNSTSSDRADEEKNEFQMPTDSEFEEHKGRKATGTIYCKDKGAQVCLDDFERLKVIGKGTFGKVYLIK